MLVFTYQPLANKTNVGDHTFMRRRCQLCPSGLYLNRTTVWVSIDWLIVVVWDLEVVMYSRWNGWDMILAALRAWEFGDQWNHYKNSHRNFSRCHWMVTISSPTYLSSPFSYPHLYDPCTHALTEEKFSQSRTQIPAPGQTIGQQKFCSSAINRNGKTPISSDRVHSIG